MIVLRLKGKLGHVVFGENDDYGMAKLKSIRTAYPAKFKYIHIEKVTRSDDFFNKVTAYKIYPDNAAVYAAYNGANTVTESETPVEKPVQKKTPRPTHPVKGDYVQLLEDGILTEDFTFVLTMVADHDNHYVILDMFEKEMLVIPLPERDNGGRKAFRMILKEQISAS